MSRYNEEGIVAKVAPGDYSVVLSFYGHSGADYGVRGYNGGIMGDYSSLFI